MKRGEGPIAATYTAIGARCAVVILVRCGANAMEVLAIDLGGTNTAIALIYEAGRISNKEKLPAALHFEDSIDQIAAHLLTPVVAVGIIVPGIYDSAAGTAWAPNLWGRDFHPLRSALESRVSLPVAIGSDRTGSVAAERWVGCARSLSDVVFVVITIWLRRSI